MSDMFIGFQMSDEMSEVLAKIKRRIAEVVSTFEALILPKGFEVEYLGGPKIVWRGKLAGHSARILDVRRDDGGRAVTVPRRWP